MKNYNRRGLITGIAEVIMAVFCIVSFFITDFDIKLAILGGIIALIGILSITSSFSKEVTRKEKIENLDERTQLVKMKSKATAFTVISGCLFLATVIIMIAYGITKNVALVYMIICTGASLSVCWIGELVAYFYFDRKN